LSIYVAFFFLNALLHETRKNNFHIFHNKYISIILFSFLRHLAWQKEKIQETSHLSAYQNGPQRLQPQWKKGQQGAKRVGGEAVAYNMKRAINMKGGRPLWRK